jgi:hypothetical protein
VVVFGLTETLNVPSLPVTECGLVDVRTPPVKTYTFAPTIGVFGLVAPLSLAGTSTCPENVTVLPGCTGDFGVVV